MLGYIKKDLILIKNNFKTLGISLIFYFIILYYSDSLNISFLLPFLVSLIIVSTFNYDSYNKFEVYAISFPKGKTNIIKAKYLITILLLAITNILVIVISYLLSIIRVQPLDSLNLLSSTLGTDLGIIIFVSILYPMIYKMGIEKARIGIIVVFIFIGLIFGILINFVNNLQFINNIFKFLGDYYYIVLPLFIILSVMISYYISKKIYLKKEF